MTIYELFKNEIRKLLELDDNYDEPENELDHFDLGNMTQSEFAWHFFKSGFDSKE